MNCLNNLITSKFLKNTANEIEQASAVLHNITNMQWQSFGFFPASPTDRKKLYNKYMSLCDFKSSFDDIDVSDVNLVCYMQDSDIVWVASRRKPLVDQVVMDSLYTTGDICIHRAKHYIQNKLFYAAMFDLRFTITPLTTN